MKKEEIIAPVKFSALVGQLLRDNRDVVAVSDKELEQTHTVKMKINTGDHAPIKLKPYWRSLDRRPLVKRGGQGHVRDRHIWEV